MLSQRLQSGPWIVSGAECVAELGTNSLSLAKPCKLRKLNISTRLPYWQLPRDGPPSLPQAPFARIPRCGLLIDRQKKHSHPLQPRVLIAPGVEHQITSPFPQ
jgi:hypothetical protein